MKTFLRISLPIIISLAFFAGFFVGKKEAFKTLPQVHQNETPTLATLGGLSRNTYPFGQVIEATSGFRVLPSNELHQDLLRLILDAGREISINLSAPHSPVREKRRINEASALFEEALQEKLNHHPDLLCEFAPNRQGNIQRSGYPDLRVIHLPTKTIAYLDPKLFEESSIRSSFRTFYYEPGTETAKITEDALHLLMGFPHDGKTGAWTFGEPVLVDLSALDLTLKTEFSAPNRDLYQLKTSPP